MESSSKLKVTAYVGTWKTILQQHQKRCVSVSKERCCLFSLFYILLSNFPDTIPISSQDVNACLVSLEKSMYMYVCLFVGSCLATKVIIVKLPAM